MCILWHESLGGIPVPILGYLAFIWCQRMDRPKFVMKQCSEQMWNQPAFIDVSRTISHTSVSSRRRKHQLQSVCYTKLPPLGRLARGLTPGDHLCGLEFQNVLKRNLVHVGTLPIVLCRLSIIVVTIYISWSRVDNLPSYEIWFCLRKC